MTAAWQRATADVCDPLAIRSAVSAARRCYPAADFENVAKVAIQQNAPLGVVKGILFEIMVAQAASDSLTFRRAPLPRVLGAQRRRV